MSELSLDAKEPRRLAVPDAASAEGALEDAATAGTIDDDAAEPDVTSPP